MSSLMSLLGVELPIVQAPMAGHQGSALAIAVASAGGLGSLPCATIAPAKMAEEIAAVVQASSRPFNVNFFCHEQPPPDEARERKYRELLAPYYAELGLDPGAASASPARAPFQREAAELLVRARPAVVSFHFGLPSQELLGLVRSTGAKVLSSATTVEEARWLEARGVDGIIAQGVEAGGHRGMFLSEDVTRQVGTLALVRQVVRAVRVPVIAAGGIADAAGVRAALALGAVAAQIGTAYLLCPEATTSAVHRAELASDRAAHTALTNLFSGRPARGIVNRVMRELGPMRADLPAFPYAGSAIVPLRARAERDGRADFSQLWAGQNTSGCKPVPAAQLTRDLVG